MIQSVMEVLEANRYSRLKLHTGTSELVSKISFEISKLMLNNATSVNVIKHLLHNIDIVYQMSYSEIKFSLSEAGICPLNANCK